MSLGRSIPRGASWPEVVHDDPRLSAAEWIIDSRAEEILKKSYLCPKYHPLSPSFCAQTTRSNEVHNCSFSHKSRVCISIHIGILEGDQRQGGATSRHSRFLVAHSTQHRARIGRRCFCRVRCPLILRTDTCYEQTFTGSLTLGLMGLDELHLRVLSTSSDDPVERENANKGEHNVQ